MSESAENKLWETVTERPAWGFKGILSFGIFDTFLLLNSIRNTYIV